MQTSRLTETSCDERFFGKFSGQTVGGVAASGLCCSCGACAWVCSMNAIAYVETAGGYVLPHIDPTMCTKCGICKAVCPGTGLINAVADQLPEDPFAGVSFEACVGKATNGKIQANSQSGGIVSALIVAALERGSIGAALLTGMQYGNPPRPSAYLAKNADEVMEAQKSKYSPVPILSVLRGLERLDQPIAVVGVSCQMHGLLNVLERFPNLRRRIALRIGLVCDRVMSLSAIDFFVRRAGFKDGKNSILAFRDKSVSGYPGDMHLSTRDSGSVTMPASVRIEMKDFFTPVRCRLCFDKMNVLSDIVVCDPHGIAQFDRRRGESVAIVRTKIGSEFFEITLIDSAIDIRPVDYEDVLKGQGIEQKREDWIGYAKAWHEMGRPLPEYGSKVRASAADKPGGGKRYKKRLESALGLDELGNRNAVVEAALRHSALLSVKRWILYPLKKISAVFRRAKRIIFGGI